jgi:putative MATE family efflux protein
MGIMPVGKLLFSMSIPMMISMLVQALYNIVDSIFVAQISENALTAVSLANPIQMLMIAVGAGTGVGVNALLSRSLGEKNHAKASEVAQTGIFLALMTYLVFLFIGLFLVKPFFYAQTNDPEIIEYGIQYLSIVCCCSFGIYAQFIFERILQATGRTAHTMVTQMAGAIINIIFDPILIFGWFGLPALGVRGAAIATVIGQVIAGVAAYFMNVYANKDVNVSMKGFRPSGVMIRQIYQIGIPSIIMQSIGSVTTFAMNNILLMFSSTAATVFGVYFKLQSFIFMPVFGLTNGMIPIVAYNFGARNKKRITGTIKLSVAMAVSIMFVGLLVFQFLPKTLLSLFDASAHMVSIGVPALRTISWSFVFAGYCIILSAVFQALGNGVYSMLISIARQLVIIIPVAFIFAKLFGLDMVWWSYPIAEIASVILCTFFLRRILKEKLADMEV